MEEPSHHTPHRYETVQQRLNTMIALGIRSDRIERTIDAIPELTDEERSSLHAYVWGRAGRARLGFVRKDR